MDTHRRLHQVRWCGSVVAGGRYEFLMLISADVADRRLRSLSVGAEGIDVDVDDGATVRTVRLPASVA